MRLFSFLKRKFEGQTGWLGDISEHQDPRNFRTSEIFRLPQQVEWREKKQEEWRKPPIIRNQGQTSSCVAYTLATILGYENFLEEGKFVKLSPRYIYSRGFETNGGMYYLKALNIAKEYGCALEDLVNSDGLNEESMRKIDDTKNIRLIAQIFKVKNYIFTRLNIDEVAYILETTKKFLFAGTRFNKGGFLNFEVKLDKNGEFGHAVTITDYTLWKGQKALVFANSWGEKWGLNGLGIITENEFYKGVILVGYFIDFKFETEKIIKPKIILKNILKVGQKGNEVIDLQRGLQYLGFFPSDIEVTGYFGGITRDAVKKFRQYYNLSDKDYVDDEFIKKFNEIFGQ